jgi:hypothetical protein
LGWRFLSSIPSQNGVIQKAVARENDDRIAAIDATEKLVDAIGAAMGSETIRFVQKVDAFGTPLLFAPI